jgi:hypothetical protein
MKWLDNLIVNRAKAILATRADKEPQEERTMKAGYQSAIGTGQLALAGNQLGIKTQRKSDFNHFNREQSLNFTLHPATGGWILELSHYDPNHDRYSQRLHIINDGDDMGDSIAKILTVELLRR